MHTSTVRRLRAKKNPQSRVVQSSRVIFGVMMTTGHHGPSRVVTLLGWSSSRLRPREWTEVHPRTGTLMFLPLADNLHAAIAVPEYACGPYAPNDGRLARARTSCLHLSCQADPDRRPHLIAQVVPLFCGALLFLQHVNSTGLSWGLIYMTPYAARTIDTSTSRNRIGVSVRWRLESS